MGKERIAKRLQPPSPGVAEKILTFVRVISAGSPVEWSGTASEMIQLLVGPSYEKRLQIWRGLLVDIVLELYNRKHLTLEDLQKNEHFISLVQQATVSAIQQNQQEKREYLKNGLLNSFELDIDYELKSIFMTLAHELTAFHVKALETLYNHKIYLGTIEDISGLHQIFLNGEQYGKSTDPIFISPIHPPQINHLSYVLADLRNRNLLYISDAFEYHNGQVYDATLRTLENPNGPRKPYLIVSELGEQFLDFITA